MGGHCPVVLDVRTAAAHKYTGRPQTKCLDITEIADREVLSRLVQALLVSHGKVS
jgi:hypothetical protein